MKIIIQQLLRVLFCMAFWSHRAFALQVSAPKDPYQHMPYSQAFDQREIHSNYRDLMERLGCPQNVFQDNADLSDNTDSGKMPSALAGGDLLSDPDGFVDQAEIQEYEKACLARLDRARWWALAQPGKYALIEMFVMTCGALATIKMLGPESFSYAGFATIFDALRLFRGALQSAYNVYSQPENPLADLEDHFAKNQCFIPRELWPAIMKAFISARQDEVSSDTHKNFLTFALGFTVYKPKRTLRLKDGFTVDDVTIELHARIDGLFSQNSGQDCPEYCRCLKDTIDIFIHALSSGRSIPACYIHLQRSGKISSKKILNQLSMWMEELVLNSVRFEDLTRSTDELAVQFLRMLRKLLMEGKRGLVIIIEECMRSVTKRVLNGDRSMLSTAYFGMGADGSSINFAMPPMLIFVVENED